MTETVEIPASADELTAQILQTAKRRWLLVSVVAVASAALGIAASYAVAPVFTARATFITAQPSQGGAAAAALSSLGALSSIAGVGVKTPVDQYVALLGSATIGTQIIKQFDFAKIYEAKLPSDALLRLRKSTRVEAGKKDGVVTIEFDDHDPERAASVANAYIEALKGLTDRLALTEAKQRRIFFEQQLAATKDKLTQAQIALESSGIGTGVLKAEPKAAAEALARLSAEQSAAEVKLEAMRGSLANGAIELQRQQALVSALRDEVHRREDNRPTPQKSDYISIYREYKYQETLFDILSRQFELAKLDEARDASPLQVIDPATPPDRKSKPKRSYFAFAFFAVGALGALSVCFLRERGNRSTT